MAEPAGQARAGPEPPSDDGGRTPAPTAALAFSLRFEGGRAALALNEPVTVAYGRVESLVLQVPDLNYPFDLTQGLGAFKRRRLRLEELVAAVAVERLVDLLDAASLERHGIDRISLRSERAGLRLDFRARVPGKAGPHEAMVTSAGRVVSGPGGVLRLDFEVPRVYGSLPIPSHLLLAAVHAALVGSPRLPWALRPTALWRRPTLTTWELEARELLLFAVLAPAGWRLPERDEVEVVACRPVAETLRIELAAWPAAPTDIDAEVGAAWRLIEEADTALQAGESRVALEGYRQAFEQAGGASALSAAEQQPAAPERTRAAESAADRVLATLAASGGPELEQEIDAQRLLRPRAIPPLLVAANRAAARGRLRPAAGGYEEVARRAGAASLAREEELAVAAAARALGAAALTPAEAPEPAAPLAPPGGAAGQGGAGGELSAARSAWSAGNLEESVRAYEAVLLDPAARADGEAHLRLAQWCRLNGQMTAANRHLQRALRHERAPGGAPAPVEVLVEVLEAVGRFDDLMMALARRLEQAPLPERPGLARALGQVLERAGRSEDAAELYREMLQAHPDAVELLLRLAEIHRRESRAPDLTRTLVTLFDRLCQPAPSQAPNPLPAGADPEAVGLELAGLLAETPGEQERARAVLLRLLELRPESADARAALQALPVPPADA